MYVFQYTRKDISGEERRGEVEVEVVLLPRLGQISICYARWAVDVFHTKHVQVAINLFLFILNFFFTRPAISSCVIWDNFSSRFGFST